MTGVYGAGGGGTSSIIGYGWQNPHTPWGEFNQLNFLIQQALGRINTAKLVQVKKVITSGDVSPIGKVHVQPLVNQSDGNGNQQPHGTVYNLQYFRVQGGKSAVIMDPKESDIGIAVFFDRDTSAAISSGAQANPGSYRRFSVADGFYFGCGFSKDAPTQYVKFKDDDQIEIVSPNKVDAHVGNLHVRIDKVHVVLGNPDKPLFNVTTNGGDSECVLASLIA